MLYNETLDAISLEAISLDAILLNDYKKACNFCTIYIVLFPIIFITSICISIYFDLYLKKDNVRVKFNPSVQQQFIDCSSAECNFTKCNSTEYI